MKFYYASLYYKAERVTGANKRFDEVGKRLFRHFGEDFVCIVCRGERPYWCPHENCIFVGAYASKVGRMRAWLEFSYKLFKLEKGVLINDFMPVPVTFKRHRVFQLIHDLRSFNVFSRGGLGAFTPLFQKLQLAQAYRVITVSHFSANEVAGLCKINPTSIIVSYNGLNFTPLSKAERDIDVIYVATFEERKNHIALVKALSGIATHLKVVFIGRDLGTKSLIEKEVKKCSQHCIQLIESVSEVELQAYYRRSKVFCSPSLYEGFGMPIIEAAQLGARVCCSDIPVFREILGEFGVYIDPRSPDRIGDVLQKEVAAHVSVEDLDDLSEYVNQKFLWDNIALSLIDVLEQ